MPALLWIDYSLGLAADLPLGIDNRWDITIGYLLFSLLLTASAFYAARRMPQDLTVRAFPWLLWLGRYSLLFLYFHMGVIWLVRNYMQEIWGTYLVWPLVAAASLALMLALPPLLGRLQLPSRVPFLRLDRTAGAGARSPPCVAGGGSAGAGGVRTWRGLFAVLRKHDAGTQRRLNWPSTRRLERG
jgi:hypothetical protein